jgi:hypothetical protein
LTKSSKNLWYFRLNIKSNVQISGSKCLIILLLLSFADQHLIGQTITSWVPSSAGFSFESSAHLAKGADIRLQVVSTGNWTGEVSIYPEARGYTAAPVARWRNVNAGQIFSYEVLNFAGDRFLIRAGIPTYLRPQSCTRHGDYDQLTLDRGWVLNIKVLHSGVF